LTPEFVPLVVADILIYDVIGGMTYDSARDLLRCSAAAVVACSDSWDRKQTAVSRTSCVVVALKCKAVNANYVTKLFETSDMEFYGYRQIDIVNVNSTVN